MLQKNNDSTLTHTCILTSICSRTIPCFTSYSLPFDQDLAIITLRAQDKLNEFFRAKLPFVATGVKSREQNNFNCHTKNINVSMAQYELNKNSGLLNPTFILPTTLPN